jgi:hypothetical protein
MFSFEATELFNYRAVIICTFKCDLQDNKNYKNTFLVKIQNDVTKQSQLFFLSCDFFDVLPYRFKFNNLFKMMSLILLYFFNICNILPYIWTQLLLSFGSAKYFLSGLNIDKN